MARDSHMNVPQNGPRRPHHHPACFHECAVLVRPSQQFIGWRFWLHTLPGRRGTICDCVQRGHMDCDTVHCIATESCLLVDLCSWQPNSRLKPQRTKQEKRGNSTVEQFLVFGENISSSTWPSVKQVTVTGEWKTHALKQAVMKKQGQGKRLLGDFQTP